MGKQLPQKDCWVFMAGLGFRVAVGEATSPTGIAGFGFCFWDRDRRGSRIGRGYEPVLGVVLGTPWADGYPRRARWPPLAGSPPDCKQTFLCYFSVFWGRWVLVFRGLWNSRFWGRDAMRQEDNLRLYISYQPKIVVMRKSILFLEGRQPRKLVPSYHKSITESC